MKSYQAGLDYFGSPESYAHAIIQKLASGEQLQDAGAMQQFAMENPQYFGGGAMQYQKPNNSYEALENIGRFAAQGADAVRQDVPILGAMQASYQKDYDPKTRILTVDGMQFDLSGSRIDANGQPIGTWDEALSLNNDRNNRYYGTDTSYTNIPSQADLLARVRQMYGTDDVLVQSSGADTATQQNVPPVAGTDSGTRSGRYQSSPNGYRELSDGDYDALQNAIYGSATAGLGRAETDWRESADQSMANRGIWSSGAAQRTQNDITGQLSTAYGQAGTAAAEQRYGLQNANNDAYNQYQLSDKGLNNQYNLGLLNTGLGYYQADNQYDLGRRAADTGQYQAETGRIGTDNQFTLGLQSNANQLQGINDSYALNRASMLNDANAQASNAAFQAQWAPANFLSGIWNGTGGTVSSGSSGGGWNFMI